MLKTKLLLSLEENNASVGVLGLGKIGWPLACRSAMENIPALGFTMRPEIAETTNNGVNYLHDKTVPDDAGTVRQKYVYKDLLHGTTDMFSALHKDFVFICIDDLAEELNSDSYTTVYRYSEGIACALQSGTVLIFVAQNADAFFDVLNNVKVCLEQRTGLSLNKDFAVTILTADYILNTPITKILYTVQEDI